MAKVSENIFNKTECIDFEKLVAYSKSELSKADTRIVEEHLSSCTICSDIIDGINEMPENLNLKTEISLLNKKVERKIVSNQKNSKFKSRIKLVAAAIIVVLVISSVIMINYKPPEFYYNPEDSLKIAQNIEKNSKKESDFIAKVQDAEESSFQPEIQELNDLEPENLKENIMIVKDEVFANELEDNLELLSLADEESENDENHSVYMSADKTAVVSDFKEVEGELEEKQIEEAPSRGFVFTISESMPEFPGGESARLLFIKENMIYPEDALQNKTEGKVYIQCLIDKNGNIQNIEIAKGISESINAEAIRLIKLMPAWKPAMRDSQAIDAKHVIEIKFELAF